MGIRERILARPDLDELRAARDLDKLAAALNAEGVKSVQSRFVTARTILEHCPNGEQILDELERISALSTATKWTLRFLEQETGVDMGTEAARSKTDMLVLQAGLPHQYGEELKALPLQPLVVTREQVNEAMYNPDGSEK